MIGYLIGKIIEINDKNAILSVNGIGYEVRCNTNTLAKLVLNENCELFIHTHVREDDISLFGFKLKAEKELFLQLISVSGVGPKTGLEILNTPLSLLTEAIFNEDKAMLSKTPGIGGKTAEKIILELKNKVKPIQMDVSKKVVQSNDIYLALEQLGFNRIDVHEGLKTIEIEGKRDEEIIKEFLRKSYVG